MQKIRSKNLLFTLMRIEGLNPFLRFWIDHSYSSKGPHVKLPTSEGDKAIVILN